MRLHAPALGVLFLATPSFAQVPAWAPPPNKPSGIATTSLRVTGSGGDVRVRERQSWTEVCQVPCETTLPMGSVVQVEDVEQPIVLDRERVELNHVSGRATRATGLTLTIAGFGLATAMYSLAFLQNVELEERRTPRETSAWPFIAGTAFLVVGVVGVAVWKSRQPPALVRIAGAGGLVF